MISDQVRFTPRADSARQQNVSFTGPLLIELKMDDHTCTRQTRALLLSGCVQQATAEAAPSRSPKAASPEPARARNGW